MPLRLCRAPVVLLVYVYGVTCACPFMVTVSDSQPSFPMFAVLALLVSSILSEITGHWAAGGWQGNASAIATLALTPMALRARLGLNFTGMPSEGCCGQTASERGRSQVLLLLALVRVRRGANSTPLTPPTPSRGNAQVPSTTSSTPWAASSGASSPRPRSTRGGNGGAATSWRRAFF